MWTTIPEVFPFFKRERSKSHDRLDASAPPSPRRNPALRKSTRSQPTLHVTMDKSAYRPGDLVVATIDVRNDGPTAIKAGTNASNRSLLDAVLMEDLLVEVKGIERVDPQWLVTPKAPPGSKQRRGERTILESSSTSIISNVMIGLGDNKTYMVRTMLPRVLPPSYRGTAVRYIFFITVSMRWCYSVVENGHGGHSPQMSMSPVEVRTPFQIWTLPSSSGLTADELHSKDHYGFSGIVPPSAIKVEIQWREKDEYSYWAQAADASYSLDDDKISKRSESSSSSPVKGNMERSYEDGLLSASPVITPREHNGPNASLRKALSHSALPAAYLSERQDAQEVLLSSSFDKRLGIWDGASEGSGSFEAVARGRDGLLSGYENGNDHGYGGGREDERGLSPPSSPSMKYLRGKTYNIRINDQVLVRFGPRNPHSTYYFGDTVSGTLSFLREEGARRCLEVSAVLETREILNPSYLHPSRKNSSVISKVQSEYFETVCDMLNSHFIFSVPLDGPASFSTPLISVQWILRFEFVASPPKVDWSKYAHPLLIEERERGEWSLPIVVHAPLPPRAKKDAPMSPERKVLPGRDATSYTSPTTREGSPVRLRDRASSSSSF
ncbi:RAB6A-GEF complex partner protein 2 [Marchantia polymorpha subsp. ruderalis]|uniref:Uncharacterized protein n=1 Tax=Marchantia polymorpha TaxID=3197 RepID=A0A2R6XAR3_MARPO|nr:hypothetical protein MARPO_0026s0045 [Marchantia polymorpha]BBN02157.1 hypothetical protein Mp_2g13270 [Marchantia polymorpha subsp. ruderalis]|eukprot:PTQ43162.1 hypothetical protein MARPO_0026s0045 [Marchantia polymorpha]